MHLLYRMYVLKIYLSIYSEIMNNCKSINFIEEILFEMELSVFESTLRRSIFKILSNNNVFNIYSKKMKVRKFAHLLKRSRYQITSKSLYRLLALRLSPLQYH